jgi:hypothetical protein
MAYQDITPRERQFAASSSMQDKQLAQASSATTNAFNCWWYKTVAQNAAVVAQASTIMSEHRRIGSAGCTTNGHAY